MKIRFSQWSVAAGVALGVAGGLSAGGAWGATTNTVTPSGISAYLINGISNPTLTLWRGAIYVFNLNAFGHPFYIKTARTTGTGNAYNDGVTGNGVSVGTLIFVVPTNAPATLFYQCAVHAAMGGTLNIVDPPGPPVVRIVAFEVGSYVVVRSTGTNGWTVVPEYACTVPTTNWQPVPFFTNLFTNNLNITSFNRLETLCGAGAFLRIRSQLQ